MAMKKCIFFMTFHQMIEKRPRKKADRDAEPKKECFAAQVILGNVPALTSCVPRAAAKE